MDRAESVAMQVIEDIVPGAKMIYREIQETSMPDFSLRYPDGRVAAVEVTMSTSQHVVESAAAIRSRRKGGPCIPGKLVCQSWMVVPIARANINRIRDEIEPLLAALEAHDIDSFNANLVHGTNEATLLPLRRIGIDHASVVKREQPPVIFLLPPGQGTCVDPGHLERAVVDEAFKEDNRNKLGSAAEAERHLFIYVDCRNYDAWSAMVDGTPPRSTPGLPPEISCVWVAARRTQEGYVVWRAQRGRPWEELPTVCV